MKNHIKGLLMASLFLLLTSCEKILTGQEGQRIDPIATFERIWQDFNDHYGLFAVKQIDWDSMYLTLRPQVSETMSDRQLYDVIVAMLSPLQDNHVTLYPASNPELPRWANDLENGTYHIRDFDWAVVKQNYLQSSREHNPVVRSGYLRPDIGYLYLEHLDAPRKDYAKPLDAILKEFATNTRGLVLDLRNCSGGYDPNGQYVAGRFATERHLYMRTRKRNGPARTDFTDPVEWFVEPSGDFQYAKPIVVLTSSTTASAAETMLLALLTRTGITQVGATTSGAFSDNPMFEAGNGWMYTISVGDYRDAGGRSHEGIGLIPDVLNSSTREELQAGKDRALEKAIELLN